MTTRLESKIPLNVKQSISLSSHLSEKSVQRYENILICAKKIVTLQRFFEINLKL